MKNLQEHTDSNLKVILVGNKYDMNEKRVSDLTFYFINFFQVVSQEAAEKLAATYNVPYMETSAKTRHNISSVFVSLSKQILEDKKTATNQSDNTSLRNTTVEPTDINISIQLSKEVSKKKKQDPACMVKCCV